MTYGVLVKAVVRMVVDRPGSLSLSALRAHLGDDADKALQAGLIEIHGNGRRAKVYPTRKGREYLVK